MKFVNPALLDSFRRARRCEFCFRSTPGGADPAHIYARGRGNGFQMDIPENLVSLCRTCHSASHAGSQPTKRDLLFVVAQREGLWMEDLDQILRRLRWAQTDATGQCKARSSRTARRRRGRRSSR